MKEQKSQCKIFKVDLAKVEAYQLLGDDYDFNEDPEYVEELENKLRERTPKVTVDIKPGVATPQQKAAWDKLWRRLLRERKVEDE